MLILLIQNQVMNNFHISHRVTMNHLNNWVKYDPKQQCHFFIEVYFGLSICLDVLEVGNPSRNIISLSETTSTGVFDLEHF